LGSIVAPVILAGSLTAGAVAQDAEGTNETEQTQTELIDEENNSQLPAENQQQPTIEQPLLEMDETANVGPDIDTEKNKLPFSVYMSTGFHSKYRVDGGFTLSDGVVNQSIVDVSKSDVLGKGTTLGGYVWQNFDFKTRGISELDIAGYVNFPLRDNFLGGKLGGALELALWDFGNIANGSITQNQAVGLMGRLNYSGPIDATFELTQMLSDGRGREYDLILSKSFDLGKVGDVTINATPNFSVSYLDDFFGITGLSNVQYGLSVGANKGNFSLEAYVEQQEALLNVFESGPVFGIKASLGF